MVDRVVVLPYQGHEHDEGMHFRQGSNRFELQPVDHTNVNDYSVPIDRAETVINAVCQACPVVVSCQHEIVRRRIFWGLAAGNTPGDLRISGAQVPSDECRLRTGLIPDSQFR